MVKTEQEMIALREERPTIGHLQMCLSRLAMRFHSLATSALNSTYHETDSSFFGGPDGDIHSTRLRALVHRRNTTFSDYMRDNGQKRRIIASRSTDNADPEEVSEEVLEEGQVLVTESEMKAWVKEVSDALLRY